MGCILFVSDGFLQNIQRGYTRLGIGGDRRVDKKIIGV